MTDYHHIQVSVIMSVHNNEDTLEATLQSVLQQSGIDFEFIVINDGSTDRCPEILNDHASQHPQLKAFHQSCTGLTSALNTAVSQSKGQYLARIDADDCMRPGRLKLQSTFLDEHPDHVLVGGAAMLIDEDGDLLGPQYYPAEHTSILELMLKGINALIHPAVMMRRTAFQAVGGYDSSVKVAQDYELWLRLSTQGKLANLPELLIDYRCHAKSISSNKSELQAATVCMALERYHKNNQEVFLEDLLTQIKQQSDRPTPLHILHANWAGHAIQHGHTRVARKHAQQALRLGSFRKASLCWILSYIPGFLLRILFNSN